MPEFCIFLAMCEKQFGKAISELTLFSLSVFKNEGRDLEKLQWEMSSTSSGCFVYHWTESSAALSIPTHRLREFLVRKKQEDLRCIWRAAFMGFRALEPKTGGKHIFSYGCLLHRTGSGVSLFSRDCCNSRIGWNWKPGTWNYTFSHGCTLGYYPKCVYLIISRDASQV